VKTIGEKIGKHKMNYSQAASSALVTAGTIGLASHFGLPVSTTHVMSSSVAGTMVEEHGWHDGVDPHMIKHILLAWVLTMPVTIVLAGSIFLILKALFL
jgi:PiT family inorganic phosphate transporter